jgi:hypothetical protein
MRSRINSTHAAAKRIHAMNLERNRAAFIEEALGKALDASPDDTLAKSMADKKVDAEFIESLKKIFSAIFDVQQVLDSRIADMEIAMFIKSGADKIAEESNAAEQRLQKAIEDARAVAEKAAIAPGLRHKLDV